MYRLYAGSTGILAVDRYGALPRPGVMSPGRGFATAPEGRYVVLTASTPFGASSITGRFPVVGVLPCGTGSAQYPVEDVGDRQEEPDRAKATADGEADEDGLSDAVGRPFGHIDDCTTSCSLSLENHVSLLALLSRKERM